MKDIPVTGDHSGPPRGVTSDSNQQAPHPASRSSRHPPTSRNSLTANSQASEASARPFATGSTSNLPNSVPSSNNNDQANGVEGDEQFDDSSLTAALVAALVQTRDGPHPQTSASTSNSNQDSNGVASAAEGEDPDVGIVNGGAGEEQAEEGETVEGGEEVSEFDGTTTRSGRKTRRTSAALASMSQSGTPSPSATPTSTNGKKSGRIRWTPQEDEELIRLVKEEPPLTWTQMGERMGRPGAGCAMRWYNFVRQQVGEAEADELSSKQRGGKTKITARPRPKTTAASRVLPQPQSQPQPQPQPQAPQPQAQQQVNGGAGNRVEGSVAIGEQDATRSEKGQMQPSEQMQVGSSRAANGQPMNNAGSQAVEGNAQENYYPGGYHLTGQYVDLNTIPLDQLPPRLPPDPSKPGHPYPRTGAIHSNSGPNYLPDQALVKDPPIPFVKNTVIRGRRTHDANSLQAVIGSAPVGKQKKVHPCPAVNCGAAFKRSEHLKRHYKSVHRGEKPFPCKIENCGKSFSRKDNLQQHQAMVHGVRAVYTYSDGTVSVNPPDGDEDPVEISYEEVDITKTARGAARHARQQAKATKSGSTKSIHPTGTKRKARVKKGPDQVVDEDMEDAEGEEDDMEEEFEGEEESLQVEPSDPQQPSTSRSNGPRLPSNVQGLMSTSSAANQSFSIGPTPIAKGRAVAESNGDAEGRASSESNERGGNGGRGVVSDTRDPILGDKRFREMSDSRSGSASGSEESGGGRMNGNGGIDKRLRLTGDVQSHELDPALRVLADATAALSSGRSPYRGGSTTPHSSIAPSTSGLTPLIQNALEQRLQQPSHQQDIPVGGAPAYSLPPPGHAYGTAPHPFATSSVNGSSSRSSNNIGGANGRQDLELPFSQLEGIEAFLKEHA